MTETFEQWWAEFKSAHDEWKYADSEALRKAAWDAGQKALRDEQCKDQEPVATKIETNQFQVFQVNLEDTKKLKDLPEGTRLYLRPQPAIPEGWKLVPI